MVDRLPVRKGIDVHGSYDVRIVGYGGLVGERGGVGGWGKGSILCSMPRMSPADAKKSSRASVNEILEAGCNSRSTRKGRLLRDGNDKISTSVRQYAATATPTVHDLVLPCDTLCHAVLRGSAASSTSIYNKLEQPRGQTHRTRHTYLTS